MISFHNEFVPIAADELHIPALLQTIGQPFCTLCAFVSVMDPDSHNFGNLDPHPHQIKIRIRIRINLQMTSQNEWNMSQFEHFFNGLCLYLEARIWIRIRINVISRIRINNTVYE
jgi:hypothetical protein